MRLSSPAFIDRGPIPIKNTQESIDLSPELVFEDVPEQTKSLVLLCEDPDAPDPQAPKLVWLHWLVVNIPADCKGFEEGISVLPGQAFALKNDCQAVGWSGPLPPIGTHRYFFSLFALDCELTLSAQATRDDVFEAVQGHILEKAVTMGTYLHTKNR